VHCWRGWQRKPSKWQILRTYFSLCYRGYSIRKTLVFSTDKCFPTKLPCNTFTGSERNHKIKNKNFKIPPKIPNIPRRMTGIFVRQLEIIEQIRDIIIWYSQVDYRRMDFAMPHVIIDERPYFFITGYNNVKFILRKYFVVWEYINSRNIRFFFFWRPAITSYHQAIRW
jgi:hypothetical protein